jgi:hypothetical protein
VFDMGFISNIYCSHYDGYVGIDSNGYNLLVPWINSVKEIEKENMIISMQHSLRVLHIFSINSMNVFVTM